MPPTIILLNGIGSVGKSSTARALQAIATTPLLHVAMDTFIHMLPEKYLAHPDGLLFERTPDQGIAIRTGPVLHRALAGMRHAVVAMAEQGNSLILDEVLTAPDQADAYRSLLAPYRLHFVALHAPLATLEAREQARGDREIGLARWQWGRVHQGVAYDLEIDTGSLTPGETARRIRDHFNL
jgi:chloramphenicol 3-O phosphotransferase